MPARPDRATAATDEACAELFDRAVAELGDDIPTGAAELAFAVWDHLYDAPLSLNIRDATRIARDRVG